MKHTKNVETSAKRFSYVISVLISVLFQLFGH